MTESQVYKQIIENLAQIDDDIARLRHQHLMLRVDIQILWKKYNEKRNIIYGNNGFFRFTFRTLRAIAFRLSHTQ
jgi:hypothetical protein